MGKENEENADGRGGRWTWAHLDEGPRDWITAENVVLAHVDVVGGEFACLVNSECTLKLMSEIWRDVLGRCCDGGVVGKGRIEVGG